MIYFSLQNLISTLAYESLSVFFNLYIIHYTGNIEKPCFAGTYFYSTKNGRISAIKTYFTNYYSHPIENNRINAWNNYQ